MHADGRGRERDALSVGEGAHWEMCVERVHGGQLGEWVEQKRVGMAGQHHASVLTVVITSSSGSVLQERETQRESFLCGEEDVAKT